MSIVQETPAGTGPVWAQRPCPPWCTTGHHDADRPGSRECVSDAHTVALSLEPTLQDIGHHGLQWNLDQVTAELAAGFREVEPHVGLYRLDGTGFKLTLSEATDLANDLHALITMAGA